MSSPRSWIARTRDVVRQGLRNDGGIYLAATVYVVACVTYLHLRAGFHPGSRWTMVQVYTQLWVHQYAFLFPLALAAIGWSRIAIRLQERRSLAYRHMFGPQRVGRLLAGTVLLTIMVPFHTAFNAVKDMIPLDQGFVYDRFLADLDKALFFGADPFQLLYAIGKPEWLLRAIELNYNNVWFVICFGAVYWVSISPRLDGIRVRYFVTFLLTWGLVGGVLATIFSSAGPVYYGAVTGDHDRFAEQVAFLATTTDQLGSAASYQAYLWNLHVSGQPALGTGISAFPSMHLALIAMNVLFLREVRPSWEKWGWAYTAILLVSSVYLGWHYAVDGIASIAVVAGIYWAVRTATRLRMPRRTRTVPEAGSEGAAA